MMRKFMEKDSFKISDLSYEKITDKSSEFKIKYLLLFSNFH